MYMYISLPIRQVKSSMGIPLSRDLAGLVWEHLLNKVEGEILQKNKSMGTSLA